MSTFPQSDDPNYPSSSGFYSDLYGGLLPDPQTLYTMAKNSYVSAQTPEKMADVPTYQVALKTPTLTIYADIFFDSFVVAIRGTADYTDFKAWLPTATSAVTLTDRWQKDFNDLSQFQKQFPTSKYKYYGVGHSLGGTIMDQFIKRGMIESGRSYNPAINLGDIPDASLAKKNARIYASGDPLYNLEGRLDHPTEVRPSPPVGWMGALLRAKDQHSLLNPIFDGGSQPLNKALYEKAKAIVYKQYKKPSAYRSGALVKKYKELGGRYKDDGEKNLKRWFQEDWQDVGQKEGDYPLYRPTKRVSKDTPTTAGELSAKRLAEQDKLKQQIKGRQNLPPFMEGGAKTVEEKRAYQREYYRRNKELIAEKARAKRRGETASPEEEKWELGPKGLRRVQTLYESPFADEEHTMEDAVAHAVLQMLKKQKAEKDELLRIEAERELKAQEEKAQRAKILRDRLAKNRPEKKPLTDLVLGSLQNMLFQLRKKHLRYDDETGEELPYPPEAEEEKQDILKELERRKKDKKKR